MTERTAIQRALESAGLPPIVTGVADLSGGCIHRVVRVTLDDGREIVGKMNSADQLPLFEEEAAGLAALAKTNTVVTPRPLVAGAFGSHAVLLMTMLARGGEGDESWPRFGRELAALHAVDVGSRYGFHADNHLGSTFQPNTWCDDWVEFNARYRLGHQISLARSGGLLAGGELRRLETLIGRLEQFIPRRPKPALLHGDLWSGNALPTRDANGEPRIGIIDPACSVGDGWADVAMMRLFGGFSRSCHEAYAGAVDDHDRIGQRLLVYQLYHLLNHVNLFGRGYAGQVMSVVDRLGC